MEENNLSRNVHTDTDNSGNPSRMTSSYSKTTQMIAILIGFLLLVDVITTSASAANFSTVRSHEELLKFRRIRAHLRRINKPSVKSIQSSDGDIIDCVPAHLQPAFDHPRLRGQKPLESPERPKGYNPAGEESESFQLWRSSGESCPEGTVPIRRTTESDVLRSSSIGRFGRKSAAGVRRDSTGGGHEDPHHGNWWLEYGSGLLVGYWPSFLFNHLARHASMIQFGGEIVNTNPSGFHTSTQMGSGHFAGEGFGRASYFRNLQVVDWDNSLIPLQNLKVLADHPNCYSIRGGVNKFWGDYFYYGGPGRNWRCP